MTVNCGMVWRSSRTMSASARRYMSIRSTRSMYKRLKCGGAGIRLVLSAVILIVCNSRPRKMGRSGGESVLTQCWFPSGCIRSGKGLSSAAVRDHVTPSKRSNTSWRRCSGVRPATKSTASESRWSSSLGRRLVRCRTVVNSRPASSLRVGSRPSSSTFSSDDSPMAFSTDPAQSTGESPVCARCRDARPLVGPLVFLHCRYGASHEWHVVLP